MNKKPGRKKTGVKRPKNWVAIKATQEEAKELDMLLTRARIELEDVNLSKAEFLRKVLFSGKIEEILKNLLK